MTIASEITRLQNDKAAICTAIENKGVTVWSVTFDSYASCIDSIQTWSPVCAAKALLVWGGGGGDWGGGGWGNVICTNIIFNQAVNTVTVGCGGCWVRYTGSSWCCACAWTASCLLWFIAKWGGKGDKNTAWCSGMGFTGGTCSWTWSNCGRGWGWGARSNGKNGSGATWGCGGCWEYGYWGWGWGFGGCNNGCWLDGWGNASNNCCNASNCGWGWGGIKSITASNPPGRGAGGIVEICYPIDWSYGIHSASWGDSCYTCDWYCVHRFTSNGTFTIVS